MNKDREDINDLLNKYIRNEISEEELELLFENIKERDIGDFVKDAEHLEFSGEGEAEEIDVDWSGMLSGILDVEKGQTETSVERKRRYHLRRISSAAAVLLLMIVAGIYWIPSLKKMNPTAEDAVDAVSAAVLSDVLPGGNQAVLTFSNGEDIVLNDAAAGHLVNEDAANITKLREGELVYTPKLNTESEEIIYNTLTTPKGGQYRLTLSDGTRVWLNAASSIRFPVEFSADGRAVEITGEVYFDVAHDDHLSFIVHAGSSVIEDLGTAFNVEAYEDEKVVKTTLVEGMVRVGEYILRPGDQAVQDQNDDIRLFKNVDTENIISWKDGFFSFDNAGISEIMRVLSRWYDLEVDYPDAEARDYEKRFSGKIDKNLTLLQVLEGLKLTAENFEIEPGNRIVIRNKPAD